MKKYFVVSDVHSFFTIMMDALTKQGFSKDDPEHVLVVCGDLFDRGNESIQLYNFVRSLPEDRFIYIRGNHEDLLQDCFHQIELNEIISKHHISNGTVRTIMQLSGVDIPNENYVSRFAWDPYYPLRGNAFDKMPEVLDYINKKCVDYVEIGDYILVHGWIPCIDIGTSYYRTGYMKNWRNAPWGEWYEARWKNGMLAWKDGVREPGKTIICGHWHASMGNSEFHNIGTEWGEDACFEPFIDDGIIAIDSCVAYSGFLNCIVLEVEE